ncbi:zinc finger MYND domain-containing protein [Phanerochaete sordida]|uniref:Zinc finger MYND domain-containing protein n=1 Tax=Phanerochaete sordida TaxID=48140 RepID=A0A9P3GE59_9APHY|nr:zinc finger MYND domain-containing protein [Phanerochaete sordida]
MADASPLLDEPTSHRPAIPVPDDIQQLLEDPSEWADLLVILHERADLHVARLIFLEILRETGRDDQVWAQLWETDFVAQVVDIVLDGYFCGYSKEDLTSSKAQDDAVMRHIEWLLEVLLKCVHRLTHEPSNPLPEHALRVIEWFEEDFTPLWERLWAIRTPFLDSVVACEASPDPRKTTFHGSLIQTMYFMDIMLEKAGKTTNHSTNSCMPHIMFLIWVLNEDKDNRDKALLAVTTLIHPDENYSKFYSEVATGTTSREKINAAILRDFKDETLVDRPLYSVIVTNFFLKPERGLRTPIETSSQRRIVWASLAAMRRQWCTGHSDIVYHGDIYVMLSAFLKITKIELDLLPYISEAQVHALLAHIGKCLVPFMEGEDSHSGPGHLTGLIAWCGRQLRRYRNADPVEAKLLAMRRLTHELWRESVEDIDKRRLVRAWPAWRHTVILWRALGAAVPLSADQDDQGAAAFAPLERCGWRGCLCSVHAPAHRLRVCKGCWLAAYCGARCQASAWAQGGHRHVCARRG